MGENGASVFDCLYFQNTSTNLYDFWRTSTPLCPKHISVVNFINKSGATWQKTTTRFPFIKNKDPAFFDLLSSLAS